MKETTSPLADNLSFLGLRSRLGILALLTLIMCSSLIGCTGAGIYSTIAISTKIDAGNLPEKLSAGPVFHMKGNGWTEEYLFFTSGTSIWAKTATGGKWATIGLEAGGLEWDGIQSAAATENRIILALYLVNGNTYRVGLFALTGFDGSKATYTDFGKSWTSGSRSFQTIRLFCPRPDSHIYVNVLNHSGNYGAFDSDNDGFNGSNLYRLANNNTSWNVTETSQAELDGTKTARYVSGVADNGSGTIIVTAIREGFRPNGGYLLDKDGQSRGDGRLGDYSYIPTTGITWIDRIWDGHNGPGVFIAAASSLINGVHPVFASMDGTDWTSLKGATASYQTTSFIDVSDSDAGLSNSKHLVLAGTSSYIDGNRYRRGVGYNEIDVTSDVLTEWYLNTNRNSYSFANLVNYNVSKLSESTVTGMSILNNAILYISTRNNGIWKSDLNEDRPYWTRE